MREYHCTKSRIFRRGGSTRGVHPPSSGGGFNNSGASTIPVFMVIGECIYGYYTVKPGFRMIASYPYIFSVGVGTSFYQYFRTYSPISNSVAQKGGRLFKLQHSHTLVIS